MSKKKILYDGKAKTIFEGPTSDTVIQYFKDDATANNAEKHSIINGKGVLNNSISDYLMKKNNLNSLTIKSISNDLLCNKTHNLVTVNMGTPKFGWNEIPLSKEQDTQNVKLDEFKAFCLSMGNPHAVIFISNLEELENLKLKSIGPRLEKHASFPEYANIEFVSVLEDKSLRVRVWERGAGMTSACGSGACATLVAASILNKSAKENKIVLDGGDLIIKWLDNGSVTLSGDTEKVFEGFIGE